MRHFGALVLLLAGCSEYDVVDDFPPTGEPNPPGVEDDVRVDRIVQSTIAAVDVLWVVDNSCSMSDEQVRLTENFPQFMGWFLGSNLDYHIGVVSTDVSSITQSGRLQPGGEGYRYIEPSTPEPIDTFGQMALLGTGGDANERGRDAVFAALDPSTGLHEAENVGFYREDASLAVVVISDEDDYSSRPLDAFVEWFLALKPDPAMLSFSSIVGPEVISSDCPGATEEGTDYLEATRAIGGVEWSICTDDWAPALDQLGMEAAGLRREFFLTDLPVVSSIRVWVQVGDQTVDDLVRGEDYEYVEGRNSVRLMTYTPPELSEVFIEYALRSTAWPEDD